MPSNHPNCVTRNSPWQGECVFPTGTRGLLLVGVSPPQSPPRGVSTGATLCGQDDKFGSHSPKCQEKSGRNTKFPRAHREYGPLCTAFPCLVVFPRRRLMKQMGIVCVNKRDLISLQDANMKPWPFGLVGAPPSLQGRWEVGGLSSINSVLSY